MVAKFWQSPEAFILGVITSIVAGLILSSRSWYPRLVDSIRRRLTSTPVVDHIESRIKSTKYVGYPKAWHPHYYVRAGGPVRGEKPTYHLFTDAKVELQEFMGFLIPPLDFGHGRRNSEEESKGGGLNLNSVWTHYLEEMGKKASESQGKWFPSGLDNARLHGRRSREFRARRVIFFDRHLLKLFIFENDWAFDGYLTEKEGNSSLSSKVAHDVTQYAFDIAKIHQTVAAYPAITCSYFAKSSVNSGVYCDFGLYSIERISIVYHPIYKKDHNKSIDEERIYIGDNPRQRRGIQQYRLQFEEIWKQAHSNSQRQDRIIQDKRGDDEYYRRQDSVYYEFEGLSLPFFEEGYYRLICEKFKARGIDIT